jgi:hypothetical protein
MNPDLLLEVLPSIRLAYRQFLNTELGAAAYERFKCDLYTDDDSLVQTLNNSVLQYLPVIKRDVLSVCDIGGGNGKRIRNILRFLHKKFGLLFTLDFVEQSSYMMHSFDPGDISSFTETQEFEMLFEDASLAGGYDLVFLIHSIFAFESDAAVDKVLALPNSGGTIIAVSNEQDSFLAGLKRILDVGYDDSRFEISDLLRILEERNVEVQTIPFETRWAVSKDELARHTAALLEWLSLGRHACIGRDIEEQVREYIDQNSVDIGQRILFSERELIVVAST